MVLNLMNYQQRIWSIAIYPVFLNLRKLVTSVNLNIEEIISTAPKAESSTTIKGSSRNTKTVDQNSKSTADTKSQIETDHLVILCDDLISSLPLEGFFLETFGVQSLSRDFSISNH